MTRSERLWQRNDGREENGHLRDVALWAYPEATISQKERFIFFAHFSSNAEYTAQGLKLRAASGPQRNWYRSRLRND